VRPLDRSGPSRSFADLVDASDLRSVIAAAMSARPIDEQSLRRGVWTYVGAERDAGTPPGVVIATLSELAAAGNDSAAANLELTRRVILWSVEAYFGCLGGDEVCGALNTMQAGDATDATAILE
jgi:hypothetical protein